MFAQVITERIGEESETDVRSLCRSEENTAVKYSDFGKGHRTG